MHSYLKAVGFSKIKKREELKEILLDVIRNYDEKIAVEDHEDGVFVEFSKNYGYDCGITDSMWNITSHSFAERV